MTPDMSSMDWQGRIATLEREIERLRAVLEQISGSGTVDGADARAALRDTAPAAESCPNCNGLGTLDEPHLPGGNCPICRGSGLRDTAPAEEGWGYDTETGEEGEP